MSKDTHDIATRINAFKKKYYVSLMLKGIIISLGVLLSVFLVVNTLEYSFRFGSIARASLLFLFIGTGVYCLSKYVMLPLYKLVKHGMDDEEAAKKIGSFFPQVSDRLLNIIQLQKSDYSSHDLKAASIQQKAATVSTFEFAQAIRFSENKRYLKYLFVPLLIILAALLISPSMFKTSTERIVKFNKEFVPLAPFSFEVDNSSLQAFKNEDFTLSLTLEGDAIPQNAYIIDGSRKIKMIPNQTGTFNFTFKKIQQSKNIKFQAAGFTSTTHRIEVVNRPDLRNFNIYLNYPNYLGKKNETLSNVGNLQIPEGTQVKWQLSTLDVNEAAMSFTKNSEQHNLQPADNQLFEFDKRVFESDFYSILLKNQYSNNKEEIRYKIDVLRDEFPQINVNIYQDTLLYSYIALGGDITDDYGLRKLVLNYEVVSKNNETSAVKQIPITINKGQSAQRYYYQWMLDSIGIANGNSVNYWLQVWDNDGVNGSKSSKTGIYKFKIPSKEEVKQDIEEKTNKTENNIDKRLEEAQELKEKIDEAEKKLKGKKELNWQDENLLKDIIKKKQELNEAIEELKKQNEQLNTKRERFNDQDEQIKEKVKQLQELMDELLDEETKKLYEELKKLLEEQKDLDEIQDVLNKMNKKENNLEKELERTLELFKRMKFEHELNEAIEELKDQTNDQEQLMRETEPRVGEEEEKSDTQQQQEEKTQPENNDIKNKSSDNLIKEQEELQERFEEFEEKLDGLKKQNQELKNPKSLPDTGEKQEEIKQSQQNSKEQLQNNRRKQSRQSQQNAKQKMKEMAEQLQQMQSSMQMQMMQQNLDNLRDIVHNLIKLSFDQEDLMNEFAQVKQSDPRFIELAQKQLKLKDDAKIVEDSLMSLSKKVFQIASFVTREVTAMNDHMDKSVEAIRERKKPKAVSEQQFAMTSMNNLALLLDDVLQQMMQAMGDAQGQGQQPSKDGQMQLSELQQQLNQQIEGLKKSGKEGRELSEELAKLAAQQERIRKALEGMQEKMGEGENGKMPGQGIPEKMEETESDLVNKQITEETIKRQKEILTRLLQAEDAMRERDLDEERKGETAKDYQKALPKAFEEYFKLKEKEIELLKTVPPKLYPYYKKEVNDYFKRLENAPNN